MRLSFEPSPVEGTAEDTRPVRQKKTVVETDRIRDLWILIYDEKDGTRKGVPRYVQVEESVSEVSLPVLLPSGAEAYRCYVIANTHSPDMDWSAAATVGGLCGMTHSVAFPSDLYQLSGEGSADLLMNGSFILDADGVSRGHLHCVLYRNVSRLTLTLTNVRRSGIRILKSIRVCSVPSRLYYIDQVHSGLPLFPVEEGFIHLPEENIALEEGQSRTWTWYLPRNVRGRNQSTRPVDKNRNAPGQATYVEIVGETADNRTMCYRFYPGMDMVNDFNLVPNRHYTLPITLRQPGSVSDSRVEELKRSEK